MSYLGPQSRIQVTTSPAAATLEVEAPSNAPESALAPGSAVRVGIRPEQRLLLRRRDGRAGALDAGPAQPSRSLDLAHPAGPAGAGDPRRLAALERLLGQLLRRVHRRARARQLRHLLRLGLFPPGAVQQPLHLGHGHPPGAGHRPAARRDRVALCAQGQGAAAHPGPPVAHLAALHRRLCLDHAARPAGHGDPGGSCHRHSAADDLWGHRHHPGDGPQPLPAGLPPGLRCLDAHRPHARGGVDGPRPDPPADAPPHHPAAHLARHGDERAPGLPGRALRLRHAGAPGRELPGAGDPGLHALPLGDRRQPGHGIDHQRRPGHHGHAAHPAAALGGGEAQLRHRCHQPAGGPAAARLAEAGPSRPSPGG